MGNYNPVYKSIWTSQKFTNITPLEKLVFLYLITNKQSSKSGIYGILPKHVACDCDISIEEAEKALQRLDEVHLIKFWRDENLVLIHKFFKYTKGTIKRPDILSNTLNRERELLNHNEAWELFDAEYNYELHLINEALIKYQSSKGSSKDKTISNDNDIQ